MEDGGRRLTGNEAERLLLALKNVWLDVAEIIKEGKLCPLRRSFFSSAGAGAELHVGGGERSRARAP